MNNLKELVRRAIETDDASLLPLISGGAFDVLGMLRKTTDGNATATFSLPANPGLLVDSLGVGGYGGQFVRVTVPQATGTAPTLDLVIQDSDNGTVWTTRFTFDQITAAGVYRGSFVSKKKYVRATGTIAGTTPNFGAVQVGFDTGTEYRG
jgi:hypothetical protein